MNSNDDGPDCPQTCLHAVVLRIKGIGPVPAFKNSKMLTKGKLITNPRKQKWMKQAEDIIASGLLSSFRTSANEMVTAARLRSWIASSIPANDSCRYLIACSWRFTKRPDAEPGALITIEKLD